MTDVSRRSVLRRLAQGAALLSAGLPSLSALATKLGAASNDEAYWEMVRQQFPFREAKIPMNAANLCPAPRVVAEAVVDLTQDIDVDCSFNNREKFRTMLELSRKQVADQLGVDGNEVALVRNTSEANNIINNGLPLKAGDEVLLWDQNHPTNNVAWQVRAARFNSSVKRVETPKEPTRMDQLIAPFAEALGAQTRVLALTHVSNVSGVRLPIRELCELAHRRNIHVHVDGAQTWGAFNLNLRELQCDSYAASSHKWFCGPKEVGLLYVKRNRIAEIWPNLVSPGWGSDVDPDVKGARKFESFGQRDDARLAAIATTVDFHRLIGFGRVEARIFELAGVLKEGMKAEGLRLVTPEDSRLSGGVCIIQVPPQKRREVFNRLYTQYGIAGAPVQGLRLCPHIYNTMTHIDRAIGAVRDMRSIIG